MNSDKYNAENVNKGSYVEISNSAAFNNPIAQLIYSNYLYKNVKNADGSNFFIGDPYDIVGEWQAHNMASYITGLIMTFISLTLLSNCDVWFNSLYELHRKSIHVDVEKNINSEDRTIVRVISKIYKWINKISSLNVLRW